MCVFVICQALFCVEVTLFFSLLPRLILHCSAPSFSNCLVIGSKTGIYAPAWDQIHGKGIGTNNIQNWKLCHCWDLYFLWSAGEDMCIFVCIEVAAATGVANLPDGGGGFLPSVHFLSANPRYLSLLQGS